MTSIALLGTCDTKLHELLYLRDQLKSQGNFSVTLIDLGRSPVEHSSISISQDAVAGHAKDKNVDISSLPRGEVIKHMIQCAVPCVKTLYERGEICAAAAAGGSGGSSLACAVMREALPIGFPKMMISTVASGDTGPLVGETDITMMYSVVDIAGSNALLRNIFKNAAGAIVGMANAWSQAQQHPNQEDGARKRIGITMFGVTTPGVDTARQFLEEQFNCEVFVFHATGHGGQAMERLVRAGELDAVLDLTTTEICDHLMGGNMSAGPHRLETAAAAGIPYVLSLGATDMVNFGPKALVPEKYSKRHLYEHNPTVTLMRTTKDECTQIGNFIVDKLKSHSIRPELVQVVIPRGGVSMIATPGGPFADAEADAALFASIESGLRGTPIKVIGDRRDINDGQFAQDVAKRLVALFPANQVSTPPEVEAFYYDEATGAFMLANNPGLSPSR
ncbi:UPF0261-domain-containing protein [Viridothelium virens]|uniref:UPF0261-domain-containing protein n=1 Tax=Viridothelium virens TaxID=1048519 RepID=A0A6A6HR59_VIRVR|nr:UPF0261-domain-containing protein [Viridothelium virens]